MLKSVTTLIIGGTMAPEDAELVLAGWRNSTQRAELTNALLSGTLPTAPVRLQA